MEQAGFGVIAARIAFSSAPRGTKRIDPSAIAT
jgi:hypothetical protein